MKHSSHRTGSPTLHQVCNSKLVELEVDELDDIRKAYYSLNIESQSADTIKLSPCRGHQVWEHPASVAHLAVSVLPLASPSLGSLKNKEKVEI